MALFEILRFSFGSLFWGILIAAVCMALFYFIIRGWYRNAAFNVATYIVGAFLFVFLSVQCIMICGAVRILDFTDVVQMEVERILNGISSSYELSSADADSVIQKLIDEYPILGSYFDTGIFEGHTVATMPVAAATALRDFMYGFIWRRVLWCLGLSVVGAVVAIRSISKGSVRSGGRRSRDGAGRGTVTRNRRRVSRVG